MSEHDEICELAALHLYGELEPEELGRLERHLAECAECAAHAGELEAGLGRLAQDSVREDLPPGWSDRLQEGLGFERRRSALRSPLWVAAASFLAGATLAWSVAGPATPVQGESSAVARLGAPGVVEGGAFERATPPPRARDRGSLPLLELYLRR